MSIDVAALLALEPDESTLTLPADALAAVLPQAAVRGPDGALWGVDAERVTVALWAVARTLQAELDLERRRSELLDRRTKWLYKAVTGQELPKVDERTK